MAVLVMVGFIFKRVSHTSSKGSHVVFLIDIAKPCSQSFKAYIILQGRELLSSSSCLFLHLLMVATEVLNVSANWIFFKELSLLCLRMCTFVTAFGWYSCSLFLFFSQTKIIKQVFSERFSFSHCFVSLRFTSQWKKEKPSQRGETLQVRKNKSKVLFGIM